MSLFYRHTHCYAGSLGLLILRVVVGTAFVFHGLPKIQSPLNWMGPSAAMPAPLQLCAAIAEFFGGIALIFGTFTPVATLLIAATMAVAISQVHVPAGHSFVGKPGQPSFELAAAYLASALAIFLLGPGRLSVDAFLFRKKPAPVEASS